MPKVTLTALAVFLLTLSPRPCVAQESAVSVHRSGGESAYEQAVVEVDGKPRFRITNRSKSPIIAFAMVQPASSSTLMGHFYYDACIDAGDHKPIAQGASATVPLGHFEGADLSKVRGEARAVIFEDGSTSGESDWVDALFDRRIRHYDRLRSVHHVLVEQIHAGSTSDKIVEELQVTKADVDKQRLKLEIRMVDDLVLDSAIRTLQNYGHEPDSDQQVKWYAEYLGEQLHQVERCAPGMEGVRARLANRSSPDTPAISPPAMH